VLRAFLMPEHVIPSFDYSLIRPHGSPIKTFGGTASGPTDLHALHSSLVELLGFCGDTALTSTDIVDIANLIGKCVVAGNVRR
jgi:ribonucleoside-triphosphate reductase